MKKHVYGTVLAMLLLVALVLPFQVSAGGVSGPCGESSQWQLDFDTGVMEITGTGAAVQGEYGSPWSYYKKYIKQIYVREGITEIGECLFSSSNNYYVEKISLPVSVKKIGELSFSGCEYLTELVIPQGVTEIPEWTFAGCSGLASITLPGGITAIGNWAFSDCAALTDIYFTGTQDQWDAIDIGYRENEALENAMVHFVAPVKYGWVLKNGSWYYCTPEGDHTGWLTLASGTYYLDPETGKMVTGWKSIDGAQYFFQNTGAMKIGWLQLDGKWYYLREDGRMAKSGALIIDGYAHGFNVYGEWTGPYKKGSFAVDGVFYYSLGGGVLAKGWVRVDGYWCYFNNDGSSYTGWLEQNGKTYYLREDGTMAVGWTDVESESWVYDRYYFNADGSMRTGWLKYGENWYYLQADGVMAVAQNKIGSKNYFFNDQGVMQSGGWIRYQMFSYVDAALYYYAADDGILYTGWRMIGDQWYYFYKDGHRAEETYIDIYYMDANGRIAHTAPTDPVVDYHYGCDAAQIAQAEGIAKAIAQDAMKNGGDTDYARVYYAVDKLHPYYNRCDASLTGAGRQNSIYGVFVEESASYKALTLSMARVLDYMGIHWQMSSGTYPCLFFKMDGEYGFAAPFVVSKDLGYATGPKVGFGNPGQVPPYFYDYEAAAPEATQGGWVKDGQDWYFYDTAGQKVTGWLYNGGCWYYLAENGAMKTGWLTLSGNRYYFIASGAMKTGWLQHSGHWYYFLPSGNLAIGTFKADGEFYHSGSDGRMLTGWILDGGKWYYGNASGVLLRGNHTVGGVAYYFTETGAMGTGWFTGKNGWYHANASGALSLGWKTISGSKYYFYKDGHMAAETFIDNHFIDADGVYAYSVAENPDHKYYKYLTAAQAAQADAVAKAIAQEAMAKGTTDKEKIAYASQRVKEYIENARYGNDSEYHYRSPYGVFISGKWTCAGSARALGRVLDYMGYTWYHTGEDQWDHQWVCVKMDGEYGSVEPQKGAEGCCYGNYMERTYDPFS